MSFIGDALGGLFGGGGRSQQPVQVQSSNQSIPDWLQRYYTGDASTTGILPEAQNLYENPLKYFPQSTVVPYAQATQQGLGQIQGLAGGSNPLSTNAYNTAANIAGGGLLGKNPYIDEVVNRVSGDVTNQVNRNQFFAGREGSPAHAKALAEGIGNVTAPIRLQDYQSERGLMQDVLSQAPGVEALRYQPAQELLNVGTAREQKSYENLQDQIARFDFGQQEPYNRLGRFASFVGGAPILTNQATNTYAPAPTLTGGQALGAGLGLLGLLQGGGGLF